MAQERKNVIALGFFDGIHLGHQALLRRAVERAGELGMDPAVFTFDRAPKEFVTGQPVPLLTTAEERRSVVGELFSIGKVIVAPFDKGMMTMPWEEFLTMLADRYQAGWLVAGHDYRFGYKNAGTPALLEQGAKALGLGCDIIPAVTVDGVTVSSTHIRALLEQGDMAGAARFLGHPYTLTGALLAAEPEGAGARLTLAPPAGQALPPPGPYQGWVYDGSCRRTADILLPPAPGEPLRIQVSASLSPAAAYRIAFLRPSGPRGCLCFTQGL